MGRGRRIVYPGLVYHVIKRGNNRDAVFIEDEDYYHYLNCIERYKKKYDFKLFAYCLVTNHVHMLIRVTSGGTISKIMQSITVAHIRHYNYKYQWSGHVWQGRFNSPIVSDDEYLLNVMQYIEQNPLRARMVEEVGKYQWSSYKLNVRKEGGRLIDREKNKVYLELGSTEGERIDKYKRLMEKSIDEKQLEDIRKSAKYGTPYVSEKFKSQIAKMLPLKRKRGRPRKNKM